MLSAEVIGRASHHAAPGGEARPVWWRSRNVSAHRHWGTIAGLAVKASPSSGPYSTPPAAACASLSLVSKLSTKLKRSAYIKNVYLEKPVTAGSDLLIHVCINSVAAMLAAVLRAVHASHGHAVFTPGSAIIHSVFRHLPYPRSPETLPAVHPCATGS